MIAALLAVLLLTGPALAADETDSLVADAIGADALADGLPDSAAEFLEGITATDPGDLGDGISQIFTKALAQSGGAVRTALGTMALLLTILVLCAVVRELGGGDAVRLAGTLTMTAACTGSLRTMIGLGQETLEDVTAFTNLLLPTLAAATAATGAVGTSAAQYTASVFFADVLLTAISRVLLPLVYGFVALAAADAALGNRMLRGLGELLRSVVSGGLKGILFVFTAYLSITGLISGSADATTVRAAKLALSAAVPVVGSMLSDASETVLVSASLLRTSVGVFGMLAVLAICVVPVLRIAVQYLALKLTAALGGVLDDGTLAGLVESLASAMGMVLAMTASCALLLLICCVCAMKAVQL
jgi:stage III sporulation protein AE